MRFVDEGLEGGDEGAARGRFEDELPGEAAGAAFVKGGGRRRDFEIFEVLEHLMGGLDFGEGGFLGFIGDGEAGEVCERWEVGFLAVFGQVLGEFWKIRGEGGLEDGVVRLVGLDDDRGSVEVAATDAPDDLGEEFEGAFLGGEIGEGEAGVGLNDTNGGEAGKVEAAGESLGADEDVDGAIFDLVIERGEVFGLFVVAVETADGGVGEEARKFGLKEFGAKAFVKDASVVARGAVRWDFLGVAAEVATQGIIVGMESEGEITLGAEGWPAAVFADGERGGTAAVMENEGLVVIG